MLIAGSVSATLVLLFFLAGGMLKQSAGESTDGPKLVAGTDPDLAQPESHPVEEAQYPVSEATPWGPPDPYSWTQLTIRLGDTLFDALIAQGIERHEANLLVNAIGKELDLRKVKPGHRLDIRLFGDRRVVETIYHLSALEEIQIRLENDTLVAKKVKYDPEIRLRGAEILVSASLFQSFSEQDVPIALLYRLAQHLAWAIDFSNNVRTDDRLELLWEEQFVRGEYLGPGRILAARYKGKVATTDLYFFAVEDRDTWYHSNGHSVRADFLRNPLEFTRISSRFTNSRLHPILGIHRPHRGVDFAAPSGAPVMTVADGTVLGAGWMGGAGKAVRIKHRNGWISSYSHLSKILVKKGQRVRQKQWIGRVGSTGLSSGPHLDYRIKIGGRFVDPLKVRLPAGPAVPKRLKADFLREKQRLDEQLDVFVSEIRSEEVDIR